MMALVKQKKIYFSNLVLILADSPLTDDVDHSRTRRSSSGVFRDTAVSSRHFLRDTGHDQSADVPLMRHLLLEGGRKLSFFPEYAKRVI